MVHGQSFLASLVLNTLRRLPTPFIVCVLLDFIMTFNPYITQITLQTGMSEREVRQSARPAKLTLASANEHGFESIEEFEEAIREAIYG